MIRARAAITFVAFLSSFLVGCSGMRVVASDVTAFTAWTSTPPGPNTPYRFERLPSQQQSPGGQQDRIESVATASLAKVGMVVDPEKARYSVQVMANTQVAERLPDHFALGGPGVFMGAGHFGNSIGMSFPMGGFSQAYFIREVKIQMRELATQKVVFETRALNDGPWGDGFAMLPAMLDAALIGFPQPLGGMRRVKVEIPR